MVSESRSDARMTNEIDLLQFVVLLWRGKWFLVLSVVICCGAAVVWAFQQAPTYRSQVLLMPSQSHNGDGGLRSEFGSLAALAGVNLGAAQGNELVTGLAVLESRAFLLDFIKDNQLENTLFAERWDFDLNAWKVEESWFLNEQESMAPTDSDLFVRLKSILFISQDEETGLISLNVDWSNPSIASQWANQLVVRLNHNMKMDAIANSERSLHFLQNELSKTSVVEVRQAIYQIMEGHIKNKTIANVGDEYVLRVIDPAVPANIDEPIKPKKTLVIVAASITGVLIGVLLIFIWNVVKVLRQKSLDLL